ncbi:MAG: SusC/RagA family TonB-linked outer membrane protein [Cyclobacteriaceae bacterium]|nr:SusC/RagA family TonB-linked outer membrane protein [Cyclobacteriaceae bacterium]
MKKSFTAKLWTVMKIGAVQAVIAITFCGIALALPNHAQVLDREVSITITDLSFENALHEIERAANIKFAYSINQFHEEPNVSLSIDKQTLRNVLEDLLGPRKIRYSVHEKESTIALKKIKVEREDDQSSLHNGSNGTAPMRSWMQITGTVTEASTQTPMAGVNVLIKGTTNGTTTDSNGHYSINAEEKDILVFSFIGYAPQEVPVNGRTLINIELHEDATKLSEVIINAGYWEVKDQERTGNISRVTAEVIQRQPVNNPLQALQGRMPGVYIQPLTGIPGGAIRIQIRGRNSLRAEGNDPLYVIDGVPFTPSSLLSSSISSITQGGNPLASINPSDIESIEILKDADATAIYGSRGANGVVLITTKRGKPGQAKIEMEINRGMGKVSHYLELLNTPQYIEMRKEAFQNDNAWPIPTFLQFIAPDLFVYDTTRYTDWQRKLLGGTATTTTAQASLSGGTQQVRFLFGTGYYNESTVFPGNGNFERISGNLNVQYNSNNSKFSALITTNYSINNSNLFPGDLTRAAVTLPPNAPSLYDSNGGINWNWQNPFFQNPLINLQKDYQTRIENFVSNLTLSYEILKNLKLKSSFGYSRMSTKEISTNPLKAINPALLAGQTGSTTFADGYVNTWIVEPQLAYNRKLGEGQLNILVGSTLQETIQEGNTLRATGYTNDALLENIRAATAINVLSAAHAQYRYIAWFGRVNYDWKSKYILNLTGRRDGSSRFGPGQRFGNFGAAGIAWIFSEEEFFKPLTRWISFGKLRSSYGVTGSDAIGNYQYLDTYSSTTYPYNNTSGLILTRLSNPDYSWETNRKFEIAIALGLFEDKALISASWFDNHATDQLVGLPLPLLSGQSSVQFNLPATVENRGWEFSLSTTNFQRGKFTWTTDLNLTIPRNTLLEFPNIESFPAYNNLYKVGESIFTKRTLKSTGVDPQTGLYTFEDVNGDGNISSGSDGLFIKQVAQQYYGGINNGITFGNIRLDFFIQFVGQDGYNYLFSFDSPGNMSNQPTDVLRRWTESGQVTDIQKYSLLGPGSVQYVNNKFSDNAISDASFVRLKNVSLTWSLPERWLAAIGIQKLNVFAQGQNLLTTTQYIGLDPETQNATTLPPLRMLTGGLRLTL